MPEQPMQRSNAYDLFVFVLTVLSLAIMALLLLPLNPATEQLLRVYDNAICVVFLGDFAIRITRAPSRSEYFLREGGWLDLLGSIPSLGFFKYSAILRLARLSRLARITRLVREQNRREIIDDVLTHRSQYAAFITCFGALLVLVISSVLVLGFESRAAEANITSGGDALWWALVTITTVGYGDRYPITFGGRVVAFTVMLAGVGIIGALASMLASVLVSPAPASAPDETPTHDADTALELRAVREELRALRSEISAMRDSEGER
ncbi:MAG: potassium channel family protein [Actinobacteria bacterium]|nr:MAG: potassium channel family protein [Actinomycetota bacterium]